MHWFIHKDWGVDDASHGMCSADIRMRMGVCTEKQGNRVRGEGAGQTLGSELEAIRKAPAASEPRPLEAPGRDPSVSGIRPEVIHVSQGSALIWVRVLSQ